MTAAKNVREALLPCPFCGGVVETYQQTSKVPDNWAVRCEVCGAQCGPSASSTAARYNWNTRSLSATAAGDADLLNEVNRRDAERYRHMRRASFTVTEPEYDAMIDAALAAQESP